MLNCPQLSWLWSRGIPLTLASLMVGLSVSQVAFPSSSISITSFPEQASVFGEQRGSLYFYGYTPLQMSRESMAGNKLIISKTGYEKQRLVVEHLSNLVVELAKNTSIEIVPNSLRRVCGSDSLKAYAAMVDSFRSVPTMLQFDTPFASFDVDGKMSLFIAARVVDKKTRADLRSTRRKDGKQAFEDKLEDQVEPIIKAVLADIRKITCADYLALRLIYSDAKLALDVKRIQVPWSQSYTYQQGSNIVYETKYGMRGENVSTVKISDGDERFVDFFYLLKSK